MKDYHFLPSLEIINLDTSAIGQDEHQVVQNGQVNITELEKYVRIIYDVKTRTATGTNNTVIPFRQCTMQDYISNGYANDDDE